MKINVGRSDRSNTFTSLTLITVSWFRSWFTRQASPRSCRRKEWLCPQATITSWPSTSNRWAAPPVVTFILIMMLLLVVVAAAAVGWFYSPFPQRQEGFIHALRLCFLYGWLSRPFAPSFYSLSWEVHWIRNHTEKFTLQILLVLLVDPRRSCIWSRGG